MLISKTARKYALITHMRLIMKAKIDHTPNRDAFLVAHQKSRIVEIVDNVSLKFARDEAAG